MRVSRRDVLRAGAGVATLSIVGGTASASHAERGAPEEVTVEYDETVIKEYQPSFILEDVSPDPLAYHALHATSTGASINAVYGFVQYPYQEGISSQDSHLGDHEPLIVWYDEATGDVERVDFAAYHYFRGTLLAEELEFEDDARRRPRFRVDPRYHHYYRPTRDVAGERLEVRNLLDSIPTWLDAGLEEDLAITQPYDPYDMLSRESWWRRTAGNWIDASLKAAWFNLGMSRATETAEVSEVSAW